MSKNDRQPILIYLWALSDPPLSSADRIRACVRSYAEAAGMEEAETLRAASPVIAKGARGKPYFPDLPGLHFSLAHSGVYGACAVHGAPVGLDLQIHNESAREAIARRFFHPEEYAYLKAHDFTPFFGVWAAKESYVKYTGEGIAGALTAFAVADEHGLKANMGDVMLYHCAPRENYSLCLCAREIPGVRLIAPGSI